MQSPKPGTHLLLDQGIYFLVEDVGGRWRRRLCPKPVPNLPVLTHSPEIPMAEPSARPAPAPSTPFSEITEAVIDGGKAGAAYAVAKDLTDMILTATGAKNSLPAFLLSGAGAKLLPIIVCYAIAFGTVLIPGIPKADTIRKIATYAAKGAATVAVAEWMPSIKMLVPSILGLADMHDLKVGGESAT